MFSKLFSLFVVCSVTFAANPSIVSQTTHKPFGLAVSSDYIYWIDRDLVSPYGSTDQDPCQIQRALKAGGKAEVFVDKLVNIDKIIASPSYLIFGNSIQLSFYRADTGKLVGSVSLGAEQIEGLALEGDSLYLTTQSGAGLLPTTNTARLYKVDFSNGQLNPVLLSKMDQAIWGGSTSADGATLWANIVMNANTIYILGDTIDTDGWSNHIFAVAKNGGAAAIMDTQGLDVELPFSLQDSTLYWNAWHYTDGGTSETGALASMSLPSGQGKMILDQIELLTKFDVDGKNLYLYDDTGITKIATDTGVKQLLTNYKADYSEYLTHDDTNLYWVNELPDYGSAIYSLPK